MKREHDYEQMTVAEQIRQGLKESIAHARGELTLRTTRLPAPAPRLSRRRVVAIRKKLKMSQGVFAAYLNVPTKTLQSWEQGARVPKAGEARLLQVFEAAPEQILLLVGQR
jgi:putative transcriptional regulator